ncbi:DJ-1/PfpI family protein [Paenibacillus pinisoli]|uniref:DJ-1/PfpI family protein n=1 Tax=Paenibacillus pinisoli TaxID=1276110 RepID=A0A3A6PMX6_9BACL|nr:DJ-1/PfpI family protein [Paenibacillus pinisoli]RJX41740.1 DJ-1/PfpI family protein [Paenibacillus pinisoli]
MKHIQIVLFDGFDLLDALAPYEVFYAAAMYADDAIHVELVTAEGPRHVTSGTNGLRIEATGTLNPEQADIILVPGASGKVEGDGPDTVPAILNRAMQTGLTSRVEKALKQPDTIVVTVCGGSLLLAMGGLLEGRSAVTHHMGMEVLGATGAMPVQARVVDDGNLITGGGVTSGLDVALYMVERELGPRIAHAVEQLFEYERRGTAWRNTGMPPVQSAPSEEKRDMHEPAVTAQQAAINQEPAATVPQEAMNKEPAPAASFVGEWDTTLATPVGKLQVRLSIATSNGIIRGKAVQGDETVEFIDPILNDNKLMWSLRITKPMRLNLRFEVEADGNRMSGVAKAGILPASKLAGERIS